MCVCPSVRTTASIFYTKVILDLVGAGREEQDCAAMICVILSYFLGNENKKNCLRQRERGDHYGISSEHLWYYKS